MRRGSRLMAWGFFVIELLDYLQVCYYLCSVNSVHE